MGLRGRLIGLSMGVLAIPVGASASAWNPDPWGGEIISAYVYTDATRATDRFGNDVRLDIYEKQIVQTYGNLGLTPKLALIGTFDWQDAQIVGPGVNSAFSKPSSISAGLQYQISRREGHAVAISLSYFEGIDLPDALITVESRDAAAELRFLWGESRTWHGRNVFAEGQVASRMTLGGDYASTHAQLTLGGEPLDRLMILSKVRFTGNEPGLFERLVVERQSRFEMEASLVYRIRKRDYIELGYTSVLGGRSAVRERGVKLGFWTKF